MGTVAGALAEQHRVLDAARSCSERWGIAKVTVDDIAAAAGMSRATVYRLFPGGRDVLFETLRQRETEQFFAGLRTAVADAATIDELIVGTVVAATRRLRDDEHLALHLAAAPGEVLTELTADGVPRIVDAASAFLVPLLDRYVGRSVATQVVDVLSRLTISYFLAPSDDIDLGDPDSAAAFCAPLISVLTGELTSRRSPATEAASGRSLAGDSLTRTISGD